MRLQFEASADSRALGHPAKPAINEPGDALAHETEGGVMLSRYRRCSARR
jgi:hypothetical protein